MADVRNCSFFGGHVVFGEGCPVVQGTKCSTLVEQCHETAGVCGLLSNRSRSARTHALSPPPVKPRLHHMN